MHYNENIAKILQCPVCKTRILVDLKCASCGAAFFEHMSLPVLIDFETSVFRAGDFKSEGALHTDLVPRAKSRGWFGLFFKKLTFGRNKAAERNIDLFIHAVGSEKGKRVLVVGGGAIGSGVSALYNSGIEVIGTDVYASENVSLICDGHSLPFVNGSFDGVLIQAVLEHVLCPEVVVGEIHRVLKPQGVVYAETPFMQQVHEDAFDFTRFTLSGHRWLFRSFTEMESGLVLGPSIGLLWSIRYFWKALTGSGALSIILTIPFFWIRFFEPFMGKKGSEDAASGLYFLGKRSEVSIRPNDMPDYYYHRYR